MIRILLIEDNLEQCELFTIQLEPRFPRSTRAHPERMPSDAPKRRLPRFSLTTLLVRIHVA